MIGFIERFAAGRWLGILLVLLLLAGCGVRSVYTRLDWLVPWYLQDYVELQPRQESELELRLRAQLDWHCRTQLPAYATWLHELAADPRAALRRPALDAHYGRALDYWQTLLARLAPDIGALLADASDAQLAELFANLEARNAEREAEFVAPDLQTQIDNRSERMREALERWVGRLNEAQRGQVARWSAELAPVSAQWIESRRRWQAALRTATERRADAAAFSGAVNALLLEPRALWPEDFRARVDGNTERTLGLLESLGAGLEPRQVEHLRGRLEGLARDFEALACEPEPVRTATPAG